MLFEIKRAVRRALAIQVAFYGPSGSGKTFSALRFAAGISNGGKVVIIDTERGRASLYADNKKVLADLPGGFDVLELDAPYHPENFIAAIDAIEAGGYAVCLIDSVSDSWDGPGGCTDIAEKAKGMWTGAKLWNKRLMTRLALSGMHTICCLKAQDKTKVIDKKESASGKQEFVSLGMQPICEKNFFYPMLLGFSVDPKTHISTAIKCHDDLAEFFAAPHLITRADGESVARWNMGGDSINTTALLQKRARSAAELGISEYSTFYGSLTVSQKKLLADTTHAENKRIAEQADAERKAAETADAPPDEPFAPFIAFEQRDSQLFWRVMGSLGYGELKDIPSNARDTALQLVAKEFEQTKAA